MKGSDSSNHTQEKEDDIANIPRLNAQFTKSINLK